MRMKKIISILVVLMLILCSIESAFAYDESIDTDLNDKSIYYVKGYRNHDCVLSANMYMIRRAAILNGTTCWDSLTVNKLRPTACTSKGGSSLRYSYDYELDGVTYSIVHATLSGSTDSKKSQLKKLLKEHPEGIVIRGRDTSGYGHGILATSYEDGVFRAVDSAQNKGGVNKGILKMTSTTVRSIGTCVHIWYIKEQSGKAITAVKRIKPENLKAEYDGDKIKLSWKISSDYHDMDGFVVYRANEKNGEYEKVKTTSKKSYIFDNTFDGSMIYYKVRGYVKKGDLKIYTDSKTIEVKHVIPMSSNEFDMLLLNPAEA